MDARGVAETHSICAGVRCASPATLHARQRLGHCCRSEKVSASPPALGPDHFRTCSPVYLAAIGGQQLLRFVSDDLVSGGHVVALTTSASTRVVARASGRVRLCR
jgi:hypothetical protein